MRRSGLSLQAIAYHEAGHAVMCWHENIGIRSTSVVPAQDSLGRVEHRSALEGIDLACDNTAEGRSRAEGLVRVCLAGGIAQQLFNARSYRYYHVRSDHNQASEILSYIAPHPDEMNAYWRLLKIQTKIVLGLDFVWERVQKIAEALLQSQSLSEDDLKKLFED